VSRRVRDPGAPASVEPAVEPGPAIAPAPGRIELDVYGLRVSLRGEWPEVVDAVRRDFAWFGSASGGEVPALDVFIERRPPDFEGFGDVAASFVTPRNVVYQAGAKTVVDYFGKARSVVDRSSGRVEIQGEDRHLVHEAAYLLLLSRIGEHLETRGLTRMHALGLSVREGAVAVMLPSGGGKSSLALAALRADGVRLISEDSPLLDRKGCLHPFPLRIGVNATDADTLPPGRVDLIERMEFHPKVVLGVDAFIDRIEPSPRPLRHIVIGQRTLGFGARLDPLPRSAAVGTLLREVVVGVGIYQGMEFILQRGMRDAVRKSGTALSRSAHAAAGLARAKVWRLRLGRDPEQNWRALEPLLS
jgi:hypothetical protein